MTMINIDKPLFLPDGSIRSLIAILITITILLMYSYGKTVDPNLVTVWGMILAFYFGSKTK